MTYPRRPYSRPDRARFDTAEAEAAYLAAYDAVLAHWPVEVEARDVPTAYGSTRVHVCGPRDGAPLVLLHGLNGTSASWYAAIGELAASHRVHTVDTMGEPGRSVHDGKPLNGFGDLDAWLAAVLDGLDLRRPHLGGHSLGGHIALRFALAAPDRVERLVLLDPPRCFAELSESFAEMVPRMEALPDDELHAMFASGSTDEVVLAYADLLMLGMRRFPASTQLIPELPAAEELAMLRPPTLVVLAGASEVHSPERAAERARATVPGITVETLPGASHGLPTAAPAEMNERILAFLADHAAA